MASRISLSAEFHTSKITLIAKIEVLAATLATARLREKGGRSLWFSSTASALTVESLRVAFSPLNAALWRLRRRGRGFWVISLDFTCVWTRRVGSGLEPEFGAGRVCG